MDELEKIISIATKHFGVRKFDIIRNKKHSACAIRSVVCFIIKNGYTHLMNAMAERCEMPLSSIYHASISGAERLEKDGRMRSIACNIIKELGADNLPPFKKLCKPKSNKISATKRLFGFDWNNYEKYMFACAKESAEAYMNNG